MFRFRIAAVFTLLAALAGVATALAQDRTAAQALLDEATSPADLRARLVAYAKAHATTDAPGAGEAWFYAGSSWWRSGDVDSAVLAWRKAVELRGEAQDRYELAEALLERRAPGDTDAALEMLEQTMTQVAMDSPRLAPRYRALIGWGQLLAGKDEQARATLAEPEPELSKRPLWRYRMGRVALSGDDSRRALMLLMTLGVASRGTDAEVMKLLDAAAQKLGQPDAVLRDMTGRITLRDEIEDKVVARIEGRRIKFLASDGYPLSGVLLESTSPGRHRTAIVMLAPEDTLSDFDSLGVALRESGLHTLLLQPRGSGWSAAPECPLPVAWRGREERLLRRSALDIVDAVRAVRLATKNADTTEVVVAASRAIALSGAIAAQRNPRVRALILLSPDPDPVDRGALLASIAKRPLPLFLQQTAEEFPNFPYMERLYNAADRPASRISEARVMGRGAVAFRFDSRVTPRFVSWLNDALAPPVKKATPPAPPRKG
jgi:hypothetical protein